MSTRKKALIAIGIIIVAGVLFSRLILLALFCVNTNSRDNHNPALKRQMLEISLKVGDLAPIPKNATAETIETHGNPFARIFNVKFKADNSAIKKWLKDSNGIKKAEVTKNGNLTEYVLIPREDFEYAKVTVNYSTGIVFIYVASG